MPKFLITQGSYFQPFTYDELVKPLQQMADAQNAAQDSYDVLSMEAAALEGYLSQNEDDTEARALYDNYMKRLNALQNNLWNNGYTPQTRRDLSLAKTTYAQDIKGKLQNSIERRQAQSKAFWDMRHNHPDVVTGRDPGSYGLDNYLRDANFGNDWYNYSGNDFKASVAAEVKARASELKKTLDISGDPRLAGVLTRWESNGFTNAETMEAMSIVRDVIDMPEEQRLAYYGQEGVAPEMIILSESLINQYNATGAREADMPDSERNRLLSYGMSGWSEGILGKTSKDFDDKEYDEQRDMRRLAAQNSYAIQQMNHRAKLDRENAIFEAWLKGSGNNANDGSNNNTQKPGSASMGTPTELVSPGYENYVKSTEREDAYYKKAPNGTISIVGADGKSKLSANSSYDMADKVYTTEARESIRKAFGGYDIALSPKDNGNDGHFVWEGANGDAYEVVISRDTKDGPLVVRFADDGTVWEKASKWLNDATTELNNQVSSIKKNNPELKLDKMLVSPEKQKKLRDEAGYDPRGSWSDFQNYMDLKNSRARRSSIGLTGYEHYNDKARQSMGSALASTYRQNAQNMGPDSPYALHIVGKGGLTYSEGIVDYGRALGRDSDGNLLDNTVTDVSSFLEELARGRNGVHDGSAPLVRFQTSKSENTFAVEPIAFGGMANNVFNGQTEIISVPELGPNAGGAFTMSQEIAYCLMPQLEPDLVNEMTDRESEEWGWIAYHMIGGSEFPTVVESGRARPSTAKEVMRDKQKREKIYQLVSERLAAPTMKRFLDLINK